MRSPATAVRRLLPAISYAAAVGMTVAACGDGGRTAPDDCDDSTTTSTERGPSSDTVVVTASGTLCGDTPRELIVVRQPAETETLGQQVQRDRYALIGSVGPGTFDIRITIGPAVRLRDGTELRLATDAFQVELR